MGFVRDGFGFAVWNHAPLVDAVSQSPIMLAGIAEQHAERFDRELPQLADRANGKALEDLAGDFADTPQAANRQRIEKVLNLRGIDDDKSMKVSTSLAIFTRTAAPRQPRQSASVHRGSAV